MKYRLDIYKQNKRVARGVAFDITHYNAVLVAKKNLLNSAIARVLIKSDDEVQIKLVRDSED